MDLSPANSAWQRRGEWMVRAWGISFLLLVAPTWPLWQPATDFPAVPLFSFGAMIPPWLEWGSIGAAILAAVLFTLASSASTWRTIAVAVWSVSMLLLVISDQSRAQAWVWHSWLIGGIVVGAAPEGIVPALRWLTAGLYFHSAISKLDATFVATLGRDFVMVPLKPFGLTAEDLPEGFLVAAALSIPIAELIVAGLILLPDPWRGARWAALIGAVAMHLALLAILGPFGLQHQFGVLLWNLFFLVQAIVCLTPLGALPGEAEAAASGENEVPPVDTQPFRFESAFLYAALLLGIALPCFAPWGLCDPWPGWELYAPRVARADLALDRESIPRLPKSLRDMIYAYPPPEDVFLVHIPLDRWSLEVRGAPLYPHPRVQLAIALALIERHQLGPAFQVGLSGPADRWSGRRAREQFRSIEELRAATDRYWLNAQAKP